MNRRRLVIVEPSELITAGMVEMLADCGHFKLVATLGAVDELETRLPLDRPEVVIVGTGAATDVATLRAIVGASVTLVALVYGFAPQSQLRRYDAVIDVAESRGEIIETLIGTAPAEDAPTATDGAGENYELSRRETDVLVLVAKGQTNKEIAEQLNLSVHTVISHRKNIMHKTGIKSVAGLTVYAIMNNLI